MDSHTKMDYRANGWIVTHCRWQDDFYLSGAASEWEDQIMLMKFRQGHIREAEHGKSILNLGFGGSIFLRTTWSIKLISGRCRSMYSGYAILVMTFFYRRLVWPNVCLCFLQSLPIQISSLSNCFAVHREVFSIHVKQCLTSSFSFQVILRQSRFQFRSFRVNFTNLRFLVAIVVLEYWLDNGARSCVRPTPSSCICKYRKPVWNYMFYIHVFSV